MSVSITIRDVPDETRNELAVRAARSGRSLQEYLKGQLNEMARKPDLDVLLDRIAERKRVTGAELDVESILAHLDANRR